MISHEEMKHRPDLGDKPLMIKPTPGRFVWFSPSPTDAGLRFDPQQPLAAIVAYVWNDRLVNLSVIDQNGTHHNRSSITLLQEGDEPPEDRAFAVWMPYQKGQAARAEALEKELNAPGTAHIATSSTELGSH